MKSARATFARLLGLFRRTRHEAEMNEELRAHLDALTDRNLAAGMSPDEARLAALRAFGGVEQIKESARDERRNSWLEGVARDLRLAVRQLWRSPGFSTVIVVSLALGIGANAALFSVLDERFFKLLPVSKPEQLVLFQRIPGPLGGGPPYDGGDADTDNTDRETGLRTRRVFSLPIFEAFRRDNTLLSDVFAVASTWNVNVLADGQAEISSGQLVSGNYYTALGVAAWRGRVLTPADDQAAAAPVAVISHRYWQTRFGADPAALGKTITINQTGATIVGITAPGFRDMLTADITLPLSLAAQIRPERADVARPTHWWLRIMGRLKPGVTIEQARASLEPSFRAAAREGVNNPADLPRLRAVPGGYWRSEGTRQYEAGRLRIVIGITVLVLLAACANTANLLLARGAARRREFAVRTALGAGRARLVRQLLTESLLLALAGAALGLLFALWGLDFLAGYLGGGYETIDWRVAGFASALALLTGTAFGLVPALRATRVNLTEEFQGGRGSVSGVGRSRLSRGLIVAQVAISFMLLVAAGLFLRTVQNLRHVEVGFDPTDLMLFRLDGRIAGHTRSQARALFDRIAGRIEALPNVRSVTFAEWPLLISASGFIHSVTVPGSGSEPAREGDVSFHPIAPNYFATYRIPTVTGRAFDARDATASSRVAIVNQAFARKYFGDANPLGRHVRQGESDREIVGVVRDLLHQDLRTPSTPTLYVPFTESTAWFTVRTAGEPLALLPSIRAAIHELDPNLPLGNVLTQATVIERNLIATERFFAKTATFLGGVALALACVGLYGLMSHAVHRRTREIGVRMALGALPAEILRMFLRDSTGLLLLGCAAGIGGALATARLIAHLFYGLSPSDVTTHLVVAGAVTLVGAAATYLPARRAARIDPAEVLRSE